MSLHLPECEEWEGSECWCAEMLRYRNQALAQARDAVSSMVIETVADSSATVAQVLDVLDDLRQQGDTALQSLLTGLRAAGYSAMDSDE